MSHKNYADHRTFKHSYLRTRERGKIIRNGTLNDIRFDETKARQQYFTPFSNLCLNVQLDTQPDKDSETLSALIDLNHRESIASPSVSEHTYQDGFNPDRYLADVATGLRKAIQEVTNEYARTGKLETRLRRHVLQHEQGGVSRLTMTNRELLNLGYTVSAHDMNPQRTRITYQNHIEPRNTADHVQILQNLDITTTPEQSSRF